MNGRTRIVKHKRDWYMLPNILTYVRYLLIPLVMWLYLDMQRYYLAALVLFVSGLTDVADGWIARHFNMVTDLGKIIDPIADKLTQLAAAFCLVARYRLMLLMLALIIVKEIYISIFGIVSIKKTGDVHNSKWYGKCCTVYLYLSAIVLFVKTDISQVVGNILIVVGCIMIIMVSILYSLYFYSVMKEGGTLGREDDKERDS